MRASNESARFPISLGRHAAGIHHDHIGFICPAFPQPACTQAVRNRLAVRPRCAAAKVFNME